MAKVGAERGDFNAGRQCERYKVFFYRHRIETSLAELLFLAGIKNIGVPHAESLVIKYFTCRAYLSTYLPTILILHPQCHFQSFTQDEDNTVQT